MRNSTAAPAWRSVSAVTIVLALLGFVGYTFWEQDWKWGLPTPRPADLRQIPVGAHLPLARQVAMFWSPALGRPLLLHFFNPDCPCSRFNQDHVRELIRRHRGELTVVAVIEPEGGPIRDQAVADARRELGVTAVLDADGAIAREAGVYSSPQAVVLTARGDLYYRGNYNLARYCTDERTEFARLALEQLLAGAPAFDAPPAATVAYGCPLPSTLARLGQGAAE